MPIIQSIDSALQKTIGAHGVSDKALNEALARAEGALDRLRARHADGSLPLLRLPETTDDLAGIRSAALRLCEGASDIVILGTGGSSLGGQTLAQLAGYAVPGVGALSAPPRLHFIDNLDPISFETMLTRLPLATTRFVAISKSGGTAETLMQTIAALTALKQAGLDAAQCRLWHQRAGQGRQAQRPARPPGQTSGGDARSRSGCRRPLFGTHQCRPAASGGARARHRRDPAGRGCGAGAGTGQKAGGRRAGSSSAPRSMCRSPTAGKNISVLMAYADRLERFTHWYVQLWAESLGKNGKGSTPLAALGPVDQHSQVQLFIGGPRDKLFTVVTVKGDGQGPRMDGELAKLAGEPGFAGKTIGDLASAEGRATAETLAKNGCPVRTIAIERLDEASLGELHDAFHAGDHHCRASDGRRRLRSAGGGRRQSAGEEVFIGRLAGYAPRHRHHLNRRLRIAGELRPFLRAGRAERQQGVVGGATALRRAAARRRCPTTSRSG